MRRGAKVLSCWRSLSLCRRKCSRRSSFTTGRRSQRAGVGGRVGGQLLADLDVCVQSPGHAHSRAGSSCVQEVRYRGVDAREGQLRRGGPPGSRAHQMQPLAVALYRSSPPHLRFPVRPTAQTTKAGASTLCMRERTAACSTATR